MAIAFDNVKHGGFTIASYSYTCAGTHRLMFVFTGEATGTPVTAVSFNSVAATQLGAGWSDLGGAGATIRLWYLIAPTSGANTVAIAGGGSFFDSAVVTYTGCAQSGVPDAQHATAGGTSTTRTETITTVADQCWAVLGTVNTLGSSSAGSGSTLRTTTAVELDVFDSNGPLSIGSQSMSAVESGATWASVMVSFAPFVPATFAADSTFGFSTATTLTTVAHFAADSTFGFSTGVALSAVSRFAADSTFGFSTAVALTANGITVLINGVDVTTFVRRYESEITETLNQGAAQASIVVRGITPVEGQRVTISDGFANIFDGEIIDVALLQRRNATRVSYRLECDQWGKLFDRRLVYDIFPIVVGIDTILTSLVANHASGFTTANVQAGLTSVTVKASGERMQQFAQKLAGLASAVFRILPSKDIYFRTSTNLTAPAALNTTNTLYRNLQYKRSVGQIRSRVYAKGASVSILSDVFHTMLAVPLQSIAMFFGATLIILDGLRYAVTNFQTGGIGTTLSSIQNAGDTTLHLTDTNSFPVTGWALLNGQYVYWNGKTNGTPGTLVNVPSSGPGALISTMPSGSSIVTVPSALVTLAGALLPPGAVAGVLLSAGASAQLVVQVDDLTAQAAIAAVEGGDGIHEFEVEDVNASNIGALQALGLAELTVGKNVIESATFTSEDRNAVVGALQTIALSKVSTTLPITSTRIYWIPGRRRPQRDVSTATIQKTLYQFLVDLRDAGFRA